MTKIQLIVDVELDSDNQASENEAVEEIKNIISDIPSMGLNTQGASIEEIYVIKNK